MKMTNDTIFYAFPIKRANLIARPHFIELFDKAAPVFSEDRESESQIVELCEKYHTETNNKWKKGYVIFKNDAGTLERQVTLYKIEPHLVGEIVKLVVDHKEIKFKNKDSIHFFWLTE